MDTEALQAKYERLSPALTERSRRLWAASEAMSLGHGGIAAVVRATGISRSTVTRGIRELEAGGDMLSAERSRRPGGGRKRKTETDPSLVSDLEALIEPTTAGLPNAPLRWTTKSVRHLAEELRAMGHDVGHSLVAKLLREQGYTLQANQKAREGKQHPDRDHQFQYLSKQVCRFQVAGNPVISVDTKKKELVGDFKNAGREWRPKKSPERVRVHDFKIPELGKAVPYGVYDLSRDEGWVSVGVDHDTASFATNAIRSWWRKMGRPAYGDAKELLITADAGGSNSPTTRLWKWELQRFANRTGLSITVCHYPPGTSKWNKIEHRLFSHIAMNWRGKPLTSLAVIVSLIGATTTAAGLRVRTEIDKRKYPQGVSVSNDDMEKINLERHTFHGEWNYTIHPVES